jgi:hypothetical protein
MINIKKLEDCIKEYRNHCENSIWIKGELYKFQFSNWLNSKLNVHKQTVDQIYDICLQSQNQNYSGKFGLDFIKQSGVEKSGDFLSKGDAEIFKYLLDNDCDKDIFTNLSISFPILSAWLGTIFPQKYVCVSSVDYVHTISFLFDLDKITIPTKGFEYFEFGQEHFKLIKKELKELDFKGYFLPEINRYRKSLKTGEKLDYDESDWNWIVEDFNLYIHRVYLKLYQERIKRSVRESALNENLLSTNKVLVNDDTESDTENKFEEFTDDEVIEMIDKEEFDTLHEISKLERKYQFIKSEFKEYLSKKIERGNFAERIKKTNNYKCSICESMKLPVHGFRKKDGDFYIEAHHVYPVSGLLEESLTSNIITVCPNHHRQLHFGKSEVSDNNYSRIIFRIDGKLISVNKLNIM